MDAERPDLTVVLDVDGVIVESNWTVIERLNSKFGTSYDFEQITTFEYDFLTDEQRQYVYDECWHDPCLYDNVRMTTGQLDVLYGLREVARVVVCSSPLLGHIRSKYEFLSRYFHRNDIYLCSDKSLIKGDILVDDGPHNIEAWPGHAIIFDRPWNKGLAGPRATSFEDIGPMVIDYAISQGLDV